MRVYITLFRLFGIVSLFFFVTTILISCGKLSDISKIEDSSSSTSTDTIPVVSNSQISAFVGPDSVSLSWTDPTSTDRSEYMVRRSDSLIPRTIFQGEFTTCQNIVINPDLYRFCQKCERKKGNKVMSEYSDSDFEPNLEIKIDIEPMVQSNIEPSVQSYTEDEDNKDLDWDNKDINIPRRLKSIKINQEDKKPSKVKIDVVDDTSGTSSTSTSKISSGGEENLHKKQ